MKYTIVLLSFLAFSCATTHNNQPQQELTLLELDQQFTGTRQVAVESMETSQNIFDKMFSEKNYIARLGEIAKYAHQLYILQDHGNPRKRILEKFNTDLNAQINLLKDYEEGQSVPKAWLPLTTSGQYEAKLQTIRQIRDSFYVMVQLEGYLVATKVMEDNSYDQNIYYRYMVKALQTLSAELQNREGANQQSLMKMQFSYGDFLSTVARQNLHKVFTKENRVAQKKVDSYFAKLQNVKSSNEAKALINSADMIYARSYLAYSESSGSSDIDGHREDMNKKISTYFGLEMIKYLYSHLN